ncbi:acyltransferase [uncultured Dubosiella sp.]|uniref:acyltransferase n=1 Tax=uncultured Dubosiella sp. TaxID=1937011 RepID=UPI0025967DE7|nr:acyltransferase [uncultured Dubosiella sp.]
MSKLYRFRNIYSYGKGMVKLFIEECLNGFRIKIHGIKYLIDSRVRFYVTKKAKLDLGSKTWISENCTFSCDEGGEIELGYNNFFGKNCTIISLKKIKIGDNNLFGPNVTIVDHDHCFRDKYNLICKQGYIKDSITIGSNIWIGGNVTICKGVTIVDRVVIGANALVSKDINSPGVYGGIPARKIKDI